MAKRKFSLPKWGRIVVWILGALAVLVMVAFVGWKIWLSTWKTYQNEEFGFGFRYPSNWFVSGNEISPKVISKTGDSLVFWIDSKENLPSNGQDVRRSQGDVEVWINKKPTTFLKDRLESYKKYNISYKDVKYGQRVGYTRENIGIGQNTSIGGTSKIYFGADKSFVLETNDYVYYVDTQSYSQNANVLSNSKGYSLLEELSIRFYHWIGASILNSFDFTK